MKNWMLAARPKTLTAALVPILVGTSLAYAVHGKAQLYLSLLAFVSAVFIQVGTNLINDALDFEKGADTHERIGPLRVTQSGLMTPRQVWWGGMLCFFLACIAALPLVYVGGQTILVIDLVSLFAGYIYTGGPYPLAYHGLGDLFVFIFFGIVAVFGMYFHHVGTWDFYAMTAASQVGLLATVMIAINNLRDHTTDVKSDKRTLAVRFGAYFSRVEITGLVVIPFLIGIFWWQQGYPYAFGLPLLVAPLGAVLALRIWSTEPGVIYNRYLAQGALLHLSFGVLLSVGLWIGK